MAAIGSSADNALAEAFDASYKRETLAGASTFPDVATARRETFRWVNRHNTRRRHSAIGNISPVATGSVFTRR
jgi:transposase InsO family protein